MPENSSVPQPPQERQSAQAPPALSRRRGAALSLLGTVLALGLLFVVALLLAPTENAGGSCTGIGFGCTPSPQTTLVLLGAVAGLPLVLALLLFGGAGTAALLRWTRLPGVAAGVLGTLAAAVTCAVLGFILLLAM